MQIFKQWIHFKYVACLYGPQHVPSYHQHLHILGRQLNACRKGMSRQTRTQIAIPYKTKIENDWLYNTIGIL